MDKSQENEMKLISEIAKETGVAASTIRWCVRTGKIYAEIRQTIVGPAWFTTAKIVMERKAIARTGRPRKNP